MLTKAVKVNLSDIATLRALYLQETNFQIRYNACHERGWTDSYLLMLDDTVVGYGSIKGQTRNDRDTIFEFYVVPYFRNTAALLFEALIKASQATWIECQSNDLLLSSMLYEFAKNIHSETVLFGYHVDMHYQIPGANVRLKTDEDTIFEHHVEPEGDYVLELEGKIVGTGGFMLHYNKPFADVYMEVNEEYRLRGCGTYLVQEVMKACFLAGRVPAARCSINNKGSKATLIKAGMRVCGYLLLGQVQP